MIKATAMTLSALANIGLLALWLSGANSELARNGNDAPRRTHAPTVATADDQFAHWLALGLDEREAKRLLFATLEAAAVAAIDSPWQRYWQSGDPAAEYAVALQEAYGRIRTELEREFGAAAAASPEFNRAFRPLDVQVEFLSGPEQIELQQRRLQARDRNPASASAAAAADVSLDFLAPAAAFEVLLRDSPRAAQLRRSGAVLEEHEFREAYALLERADTATDLAVQASTRQRLRALLGAQRFTAVVAERDPLFAIVRDVGREHGLDAAALAAANEVLSDAQGQLLDLAVARVDDVRAAASAAAITATERERLEAAVGEGVAAAILAARAEFYVGARLGTDVSKTAAAP